MIRVFLGLTVLLSLSINFKDAFFLSGKWSWISWLPAGLENLALSAIIVAVFMAVARIPSRVPDTRPGQGALTFGLIAYVVVQFVAGTLLIQAIQHLMPNAQGLYIILAMIAMVFVPLMALVQAILVLGTYRVLTNLNPARG